MGRMSDNRSTRGRTCESCGVKMPFGVRRRAMNGKKVCEGCASGRPGRPLSQGSRRMAAPFPPPRPGGPPRPSGGPPGAPGPGGPPGAPPEPPGGGPAGIGSFAPDRESDKVVRVCPFCGSGNLVGQSDGSIKCGHEDISFLVEILPRHPFQPLVDPDGNPFELNTADDEEPPPEIGVARAAPQPGGEPVDGGFPPAAGDDGEEDDDDLPEFLKGSSLYIAEDGTAMSEDAYVEHLASQFGRTAAPATCPGSGASSGFRPGDVDVGSIYNGKPKKAMVSCKECGFRGKGRVVFTDHGRPVPEGMVRVPKHAAV
jgi:hypothetical protein